MEDPDLSDLSLSHYVFVMLLLLSGKIHFGDIYAIFCDWKLTLYFLFNLMSQV